MNKILWITFGAIVIIMLIGFFFPKNVGGPLCGPVCPSLGLFSYSKPCFGFKETRTYIDGFSDDCYGIPYGEKKCYGLPFSSRPGSNTILMDCDYPCNDREVRASCDSSDTINMGGITIDCNFCKDKCDW